MPQDSYLRTTLKQLRKDNHQPGCKKSLHTLWQSCSKMKLCNGEFNKSLGMKCVKNFFNFICIAQKKISPGPFFLEIKIFERVWQSSAKMNLCNGEFNKSLGMKCVKNFFNFICIAQKKISPGPFL